MRNLLIALALALVTTACGQAPTLGEQAAALAVTPIPASAPAASTDNGRAPPPAIDEKAHPAATYAIATATCSAAGRPLCTKTQLIEANKKGHLDFHAMYPRTYWMATEATPGVGFYTNAAGYITAYPDPLYYELSAGAQNVYYCCRL